MAPSTLWLGRLIRITRYPNEAQTQARPGRGGLLVPQANLLATDKRPCIASKAIYSNKREVDGKPNG